MNDLFSSQEEYYNEPESIWPANNKKVNLGLILSILAIIFLGLIFRTFSLQILNTNYYQNLASGNKLRRIYITPSRGIIVDRNGKKLAYNQAAFNLIILPIDLPQDKKERGKLYQIFVNDLKIDVKTDVEKAIALKIQDELTFPLEISQADALVFKEKYAAFAGFALEQREKRTYAPDLSHILGYLGKINDTEWETYRKNNYLLFEWIGKAGLEKQYESELRGTPGAKEVEVDALGKTKKTLARIDPQAGSNLKLTLDYKLQQETKEILARNLAGRNITKGAAVILDPRNGGILSLVSLPDYDNNLFIAPKEDLNQILQSQDQPLFNRVISGLYPSGSTIKPVIASAGLQEGLINATTTFDCQGFLKVINQYDPSIIYYYKDNAVHGLTNVYKALAESCNVFFYTVGGGYGGFPGLGIERLDKYLNIFGLGRKTNIDLPGEEAGLVPTPEWKENNKHEPWYLGDTYHLSIGQGDFLVTPLQVARYTMAIANRGTLFEPHLVQEIIDNASKTKKKLASKGEKIPVSENNLEIVRQGMQQAVLSGSAHQLKSLNVSSAAKTGTAEDPLGGEPYGWFTVFAPYDNPEIVVTVMFEHGGEGYYSAEPTAKEILEYWQNNR